MTQPRTDAAKRATISIDLGPEDEAGFETGKLLVDRPGTLFVISRETLPELVAHVIDYVWNHSKLDVSPILLHEAIESFVRGNRQQEDEQSRRHKRLHADEETASPPV